MPSLNIALIQMDMALNASKENLSKASFLASEAMKAEPKPDVLVFPETWNTGFCPAKLQALQADAEGKATQAFASSCAKENNVNIVCGSVTTAIEGKFFNTCYVADRSGTIIASYNKTHLFSPMGEDKVYNKGQSFCSFTLDGVKCAVIICYDLRFPELTRKLALNSLDLLFVVSQWPEQRREHLLTLARARAIENQMFLCLCNSPALTDGTKFAGSSCLIDPLGNIISQAGDAEEILQTKAELDQVTQIRDKMAVYADRRPELY